MSDLQPIQPKQLLPRFHHNSHQHKLFQTITRNISIFCDNVNCARRILNGEVSYVCFKCDFDLCAHCFLLPTVESSIVQLAADDQLINEDALFKASRYNTFAENVRIDKEATERAVNNEDNTFDVQLQPHNEDFTAMEQDDEEEDVDDDGDVTEPESNPTTNPSQSNENKELVDDHPVQIRLNNPTYDTQTNASVNYMLSTVQPRIRVRRSLRTERQQTLEEKHDGQESRRRH